MNALALFARGVLRNPRRVGAIVPASQRLASAIAAEVQRSGVRTVIEIGAGTGAITRALEARRPHFDRIVAVERDEGYVKFLAAAFPHVEVLHECASSVDLLPVAADRPLALVSSLPLLSMGRRDADRCIGAFDALLSRNRQSILIQYTYSLRSEPFPPRHGMGWTRSRRVWANLPPASVWLLKHV